jgi:hypothetical protein
LTTFGDGAGLGDAARSNVMGDLRSRPTPSAGIMCGNDGSIYFFFVWRRGNVASFLSFHSHNITAFDLTIFATQPL